MWTYLAHLPPVLSVMLLILAVLAIVVISLKGHLAVKWGKTLIGLGGEKSEQASETPSEAQGGVLKPSTPVSTVVTSSRARRSCGDCILILMGEREKFEFNMKKRLDRLLKSQMNFVEQKMVEIEGVFNDSYATLFNSLNTQFDNKQVYEVEYKLFYGLLRDSLMVIKNEFRRSLKENGFYELSDTEFSTYIKDRTQIIITMMTQQLRNLYPVQGVSVPIEKISEDIEKKRSQLNSFVFEIFVNSKQEVLETDKEVESLKDGFAKWVDEFVG